MKALVGIEILYNAPTKITAVFPHIEPSKSVLSVKLLLHLSFIIRIYLFLIHEHMLHLFFLKSLIALHKPNHQNFYSKAVRRLLICRKMLSDIFH